MAYPISPLACLVINLLKTRPLLHLFSPWAILSHWLMSPSIQQHMPKGLESMSPSFLPTQLTLRGVFSPFGDAVIVSGPPHQPYHHGASACMMSHLYFCTCLLTTVLFPEGASAQWPGGCFRNEKHPKLFSCNQPHWLLAMFWEENPHCPVWDSSSTYPSLLTDPLTSSPVMISSTKANLPVIHPSYSTWFLLWGLHSFLVFCL